MLLCKNRRLFTVAGDNSHVLTPIPMHLIPIPIPFPSHGWSYTHSHGNPMGSQSSPFPCTPLLGMRRRRTFPKVAIARCRTARIIISQTRLTNHSVRTARWAMSVTILSIWFWLTLIDWTHATCVITLADRYPKISSCKDWIFTLSFTNILPIVNCVKIHAIHAIWSANDISKFC